jgi:Bacterial PH domain
MMDDNLLNQGIAAVKSGDKVLGRQLLAQLVKQDPSNEMGWLWLSTCIDSLDQKKYCLKEVLKLNPKNQDARAALDRLEPKVEAPKLDDIVPPKPTSTPTAQPVNNAVVLPKSMARFASPVEAPNSQPRTETKPAVNTKPTSANSTPEVRGNRSGNSFVEQNLMPGEQIIYRTHVHWIIYFAPLPLLVFAAIMLVVIGVLNSSSSTLVKSSGGLFSGILFLTGIILPLILIPLVLIRSLIYSKTREFAVTNKRVLIKWGFIQRHSMEVLLKQIEGIMVFQPIMGRLFGYGTISVTGTGGTHERFPLISQPLEFRRRVQHQIEMLNQ